MNIPDVPESITQDAYSALMESLGFTDLGNVCKLEFCPDGVYATLLACGENGRLVVDKSTGDIVEHRVYIPVRG